jgi:hypothetical protein
MEKTKGRRSLFMLIKWFGDKKAIWERSSDLISWSQSVEFCSRCVIYRKRTWQVCKEISLFLFPTNCCSFTVVSSGVSFSRGFSTWVRQI